MKTKGYKNSGFSYVGAIIFFVIIALLMQIAILVYDYIRERTDNNVLIAILILIVIIILSGVCTLIDYLRRRATVEKPVERILFATERIASGDFDTRIEIANTYDKYNGYDLISENLNIMAAELSRSEILKNDFVSNVSHELKTPIAVISGYADALRDQTLPPEEREKIAEALSRAAKRLSALVSNILKLTKLENQETRPELERFNLTSMLGEVILGYESVIENKGLTLECDLDDVYITSSPSLLELVFHNLISNAIKFTDKGTVSISLKRTDDRVSVQISDTGCGMSRDVGMKIFEKFYQGDTSHAGEGNGLGLALVRRVIDILGGEITVSSELSHGSTFTVTIEDAQ